VVNNFVSESYFLFDCIVQTDTTMPEMSAVKSCVLNNKWESPSDIEDKWSGSIICNGNVSCHITNRSDYRIKG